MDMYRCSQVETVPTLSLPCSTSTNAHRDVGTKSCKNTGHREPDLELCEVELSRASFLAFTRLQ